jgi:hypothetical protein
VLRNPICTTLGSLALEIFLFGEAWKGVVVHLGFGTVETFPDSYSPVLFVASVILLAYVVTNKVVQPLLSSAACDCSAACANAPNEPAATGSHDPKEGTTWTDDAKESV